MHAVLVAGQPQQPQRVRERRPCCRHPGLRATPGCYRSARGPARSSARPCNPSHTSWQFNRAPGHMVASLLEPPKPMRHVPLREHLVKSTCGSWGEPRRARECTLAAPPDPRPLQAGTAGQIQSMHRRGPAPCGVMHAARDLLHFAARCGAAALQNVIGCRRVATRSAHRTCRPSGVSRMPPLGGSSTRRGGVYMHASTCCRRLAVCCVHSWAPLVPGSWPEPVMDWPCSFARSCPGDWT